MHVENEKHQIGILGSSGLIGCAFLDGFQKSAPICLGRSSAQNRFLDLSKITDKNVFKGIDVLIHAAGITEEGLKADPEGTFWRAGYGAQTLFENAAVSGVKTIVYISSAHVYGAFKGTINEENPSLPVNDYGGCHLLTERLLYRISKEYGIRVLVVRPNAVFGTSFNPEKFTRWHLVPFLFPKIALETGKIVINSPHTIRNFISTHSIFKKAQTFLENNQTPDFYILNPVGPDTLTILNFAEMCAQKIEEITGKSVDLQVKSSADIDTFRYATLHTAEPEISNLPQFLSDYINLLTNNMRAR